MTNGNTDTAEYFERLKDAKLFQNDEMSYEDGWGNTKLVKLHTYTLTNTKRK